MSARPSQGGGMAGEPAPDWRTWTGQHIPATERQRGGAAAWPRGHRGLIGDPLGPILHLHDGASEVFYFLAGRCRLEIGNAEAFFGPGDFVLIPPEVPHNLWNAADEDLLVFWIVAPNVVNNKWRTTDFPPEGNDKRAPRGRVDPGVDLPSDKNILSRLLTLGQSPYRARTAESQETIIYVTQGEANVTVGRLTGKLRRGQPPPAVSRLPRTAAAGPKVSDDLLYRVVDAIDAVAAETGKSVPQVALNWLLQKPTIASVIVGARNEDQLRQNLGATGWSLTAAQVAALDSASAVPVAYPYWHQRQAAPDRNPLP